PVTSPVSVPSLAPIRYTLKLFSKYARTAALSLPLTKVAAAHGACHIDCDAAAVANARQPTRNAGHTASTRSSRHPGNASKCAGEYVTRGAGGGTRGAIGGAT